MKEKEEENWKGMMMVQAYPKGFLDVIYEPDAIQSPEWALETFLDDISKSSILEELFKKALENLDANLFMSKWIDRKEFETIINITGTTGFGRNFPHNLWSKICRYEGNFYKLCFAADYADFGELVDIKRWHEIKNKSMLEREEELKKLGITDLFK